MHVTESLQIQRRHARALSLRCRGPHLTSRVAARAFGAEAVEEPATKAANLSASALLPLRMDARERTLYWTDGRAARATAAAAAARVEEAAGCRRARRMRWARPKAAKGPSGCQGPASGN